MEFSTGKLFHLLRYSEIDCTCRVIFSMTRSEERRVGKECLHLGRDLAIFQQCRLSYSIKLITDEVVCDVAPLNVADVLLGQPYLWRQHDVY